MGSQPAQADASESRKDVAFDVAAVPGVGARGEHDPLARQPLPGEEGAERQRSRLVVAAVALSGQPGGQLLGVGAIAAGSVPAAALSSGDRVDALVDDGVPAVSLSGDVTLHGVAPSGSRAVATR